MERLTTAQWEKMEECVKGLAPEILNISDPSAFISAVLRFMMAMQQQRAAAAAANGGSNSTGEYRKEGSGEKGGRRGGRKEVER